MRLEQVRAFVVLAEELNFRRAAARLFVSQPTLTAQLHQLERDLTCSPTTPPWATGAATPSTSVPARPAPPCRTR
jgi:Bacterial regulatory helix-turn-helix protein, lysR family